MIQTYHKNTKIKGFLSVLMACLILLSSFGVLTSINYAAGDSMTLVMIDWKGISHGAGTISNGKYYKAGDRMEIFGKAGTGETVYCVEPGVGVSGGTKYTSFENYFETGVVNDRTTADEKMHFIGQLIQYGPTHAYSGSVTEYEQFAAIQFLIWEVVLEERDADFNYVGPKPGAVGIKSLYSGSAMSRVNGYYNDYAGKIVNYSKIPSFAEYKPERASTIKLNQYDGTYFYKTVHDDNGVLSNFNFSMSGVEFVKNGNDLTIKSRDIIKDATLISGENVNLPPQGRKGLVFWGAGASDQKICSLSDVDDPAPKAYFKIVTDVFGQIIVHKTSTDTTVSNENGNYSLAGAQFKVTGPNGYNKVITTDSSGVAKTESTLYLGTYTITEIKAPPGFTINSTPQTVTISESSRLVDAIFTEEATQPNVPQMGIIRIQKATTSDADCEICNKVPGDNILSMAGGIFEIKNASGVVVETLTTDSAGFAQSKQLPLDTYSITEITPPAGYIKNDDIDKVTLSYGDQAETVVYKTANVPEEHQHGTITITKNDIQTGNNAQGKATLNGAVFTIKDKDTMTLLQTLTCTEDTNTITSDLLPVGKTYVVEEIKPPTGYNPTDIRYEVTLTPDKTNNPVIPVYTTVKNEVIRGSVKIIKSKEEIMDNTKVTMPFEGVEFILTSKTTGQKYHGDTKLTDAQGIVVFSNLPYDDYIVHEVTPNGYLPLADFTVNVETQNKVYEYAVTNMKGLFELIINKVDAETGKLIKLPNASFQLYNDVNGNEKYDEGIDTLITWQVRQEDGSLKTTDTIYTSVNGVAMLPEKLDASKKYLLKEITAPEGYVIEKEYIPCDISKGESDTQQVLKFSFKNMPQKANIIIYKTGEQLINATQVDSDYGPVYTPIYGIRGLEGAKFKIVAAEDIKTPDGTIRYTKGTVISTITTGKDGKATCPENLYLGKYQVIEIEAPYGYVLDTTPYDVELKYAGQNVAIITKEVGVKDERQKAEIDVTKYLEVPDSNYTGDAPSYNGIVFGLFAAKDIQNVNGVTAIPADALLELLPLNDSGHIKTTTDLPFGSYYVMELKTNDGYELNTQKYLVNFLYQGEETKVVLLPVNDGNEIINNLQRLDLEIVKTSKDNINIANIPFHVTGTSLTGHTYDQVFYTDEDGKISISGLLIGVYTITELECDENKDYVIPDAQEVTLISENAVAEFYNQEKTGEFELLKTFEGSTKDTNANLVVNPENKDDSEEEQSLDISEPKDIEFTDEDGNIITRYVKEGVPFHIWGTSDAGYVYDEVLYTDEDGKIIIKNLPVGEYNAEELTGEWTVGYIAAGKFTFSIKQDETIEKVVNNEKIRGTFDFTKEDISTGEVIPDCGVRIEDEKGNVVFEGRTDKDGKIVIELEYGKYTYQEYDAPTGYEVDEGKYPFEIKENGEIIKAVMKDKPILTDVTIIKRNRETSDVLSGAKFGIFKDGSKDALQIVITGEDGSAIFTGLRYGTYEIKELEAPAGYVVNAETIKFTIDENNTFKAVYDFYDTPVPKTGLDYLNVVVPIALSVITATLIGGVLIVLTRKKKKEQ